MFCEKCGKEIAGGLRICDECRTKEVNPAEGIASTETNAPTEAVVTPEEGSTGSADATAGGGQDSEHGTLMSEIETITDYQPIVKKNKQKKIMIASAVAVVAVVAIAGAVFATMNSGKKYLYGVLLATGLHYNQEYKQMTDGNQVLSKAKEIMSKSYTQEISAGDFKATINDDKDGKKIGGDLAITGIPIGFRLYLTDTRLIVGSPMLTFLEADPVNFGQDAASFANNNGLTELGVEIAEQLAPYDFSYEKLSNGNVLKSQPDLATLGARYTGMWMALVEKANYKKASSNVPIGDSTQKCDLLTLNADRVILLDWFENDLKPTVYNDKELEEYFKSTAIMQNRMADVGLDSNSYEYLKEWIADTVEYLKDEGNDCELVIDMFAYQKVIVKASASFREKEEEAAYMNFSASGQSNRLDQIAFDIKLENDSISITAMGNHVGVPVINSNIRMDSSNWRGKTSSSLSLDWDTQATADNFEYKIVGDTSDEISGKATFAVDGDSVRLEMDNDDAAFSWEVLPIQDTVTLPANTMLIRDVTLNEILDSMGATGELIRNYLMSGLY